ncbi:MAG TPA: cell division protein SepF [Pseudonocardiaceae bacterium]
MSALQKLKAYFGMVPADEVEGYADDRDAYRGDYHDEYAPEADDYSPYSMRAGGRRRLRGVRGGYHEDLVAEEDYGVDAERGRSRRGWGMDPASAADVQREQVSAPRPAEQTGSLSRITTLHLRSYNEARTIGERYRDGIPVIMNLTEMEDADAKRLVDFAAGLAFALRGSFEKITNKVFLLSPPNVDVTAEDRRRLAEGALFNQN